VFERYSERARQVVVLAQDEACALKHNYIGTEHILLGLLREGEGPESGLAGRVLDSCGITLDGAREKVRRLVREGDEAAAGKLPFTPRAKKVLELALREALSLGHKHIGTEHILLGLVREAEGVAMRILRELGADAEKIRGSVVEFLSKPNVGRPVARDPAVLERAREIEGRTPRRLPPPRSPRRGDALRTQLPLLLAIFLTAAGFPLGLLVGWLIWR